MDLSDFQMFSHERTRLFRIPLAYNFVQRKVLRVFLLDSFRNVFGNERRGTRYEPNKGLNHTEEDGIVRRLGDS